MISTQKTGAYISQLRKNQNMTQADMAGKLMVRPQTVSKAETGQARPDSEQLLTLTHLFSVSVNAILLAQHKQVESPAPSLTPEPPAPSPTAEALPAQELPPPEPPTP